MIGRCGGSNRRFEFEKRGQLFIRVHNKAPPVIAMRVRDKARLARENPPLRHSPNSIRRR